MRRRPLRALLAGLLGLLGALAGAELLLRAAAAFAPEGRARRIAEGAGRAVVCVGDSHTFGLGVAEGEAYPAALETRLAGRGARVVNAGRPGSNSALLLPIAREWLGTTRARVLVARVGVNDFWNVARPGDSFLESLRVVRLGRLLLRRAGPDRSPAGGRLPYAPIDAAFERMSEAPRVVGALEGNLRRLAAEARAAGATAVFLAYSLDAHYYALANEAMRRAAAAEGAPFADPSPEVRRAVREGGYPSAFLPDFHPNARGYALEARVLAAALARALPDLGPEPDEAGAAPLPPPPHAPDHDRLDLEAGLDVVQKELSLLRRNLSADALPLLRGHGRRAIEALDHPSLLRAIPPGHPVRRTIEDAARAFDEAAERGDVEAAARAAASTPARIGV